MDIRLSAQELARRTELVDNARALIARNFSIEDSDEASLSLSWDGFYLQVSFSHLYSMLIIYLAKHIERPVNAKRLRLLNEINLRSVLGSHAVNSYVGCYTFRLAYWLDSELTASRFFEILGRCTKEARKAYDRLSRKYSFLNSS